MSRIINEVDVIAQFKPDGTIIPMRFRIINEDGEYEQYTIKGYKQVFRRDVYTTPDGLTVCSQDKVFECKVVVLGNIRTVRLYFSKDDIKWRLAT